MGGQSACSDECEQAELVILVVSLPPFCPFNLTTRTLIASITIPNVTGNPQRLVRWGQNALAFNTDGGQIYLIGGNFVH